MALNQNSIAQESHNLASQIAAARVRGDYELANRLVQEFNRRVFDPTATQVQNPQAGQFMPQNGPVSPPAYQQSNQNLASYQTAPNSQTQTIDEVSNELNQLSQQYQNLLARKQQLESGISNQPLQPSPQSNQNQNLGSQAASFNLPQQNESAQAASDRFISLAEAVAAERQASQNQATRNPDHSQQSVSSQQSQSSQSQQSEKKNSMAEVPDNLPVGDPVLGTAEPPVPSPSLQSTQSPAQATSIDSEILSSLQGGPQSDYSSAPNQKPRDFKTLIADYHEGVQSLLKQYLSDFSAELEVPEAVLGSRLHDEFQAIWQERQEAEPLLLKLPEYIQQRSVLLRYKDELQSRLS